VKRWWRRRNLPPHARGIDTIWKRSKAPSNISHIRRTTCCSRRRPPLLSLAVRGLDVGMNINTDSLVGTINIGPRGVEDWRECAVSMRAGGFSAEYTCSVRDEELRHFLAQLEDALARLGQAVTFEFRALASISTARLPPNISA
jgi:hypothetical protein